MITKPRLVTIAASIVALLFAGGTALALTGDDSARTPSASSVAPSTSSSALDLLSADEASAIARGHVDGGQVSEVERETEHGRVEWKVRIRDGTQRVEVRVDAATGAITRIDTDDRGSDH